MALRLKAASLCARINGTQGPALAVRQFNATAAARAGAGVPVGTAGPAKAELADAHELTWDDGSPHPEPCLDDTLPILSGGEAAQWLGTAFAGCGLIAFAAVVNDKASKVPFTPREFPDLKLELGGKPQ